MQQITLNINNPQTEHVLLSLSKQFNKSVEQIAVDLLKQISTTITAKKATTLTYTTLDADKLMTKIRYNTDYPEDSENSNPFADVSDSAVYIKDLRRCMTTLPT